MERIIIGFIFMAISATPWMRKRFEAKYLAKVAKRMKKDSLK